MLATILQHAEEVFTRICIKFKTHIKVHGRLWSTITEGAYNANHKATGLASDMSNLSL